MPAPTSLSQKPKTKRDKAHLQAVVRQLTQEPLEIARNAADQIVGAGKYDAEPTQTKPSQEKPLTQEEIVKKQKKDSSHMQAFQEELREIERLQRERQQERDQLRAQEERDKIQRQQQAAARSNSIIEPVARKARGMLGGAMQGMKKKIHDSERKVEMPKTPSN